MTPVVFRKYPDGEIIALFPTIPADSYGRYCQSYLHVGQHGGADYQGVIGDTTPARPAEYASLKKEIEGLGYKLRVIRKTPRLTGFYICI